MTKNRIAKMLAASFAKGAVAASLVLMAFSMQARAQAVGDEVLYGVTSFQDLYTIDVDTGVATFIGGLGVNQNAAISLATIPSNGNLITFVRGSGSRPGQFVEINRAGANTTVLSSPGNLGIGGLSFDSFGTLFGTDSLTDDLATYDPSTGQKSFIGSLPFPFSGSLTFNSVDELLAIANRSLIKIDPNNASITAIGSLNPRLVWLGLAFDGQDVLYATRRESTATGTITELHIVDATNAQTTLIAQITGLVQSGDSIIRLAFAGAVVQPLTARAGADQTQDEGSLVALDGSTSLSAATYEWTQVAGPTVTLSSTTVVNPDFTAPYVGANTTLTFQLVVGDGAGNFNGPDSVDIMVVSTNNPPVADAGDDSTIKPGAVATLDGSASFDPENDPISYQWTQVSGTPVTLSDDSAQKPTFSAVDVAVGDVLLFQLQLTDGKEASTPSAGTDSSQADTVAVTGVVNSRPIADAGPDQTKDEGNLVSLDGTGSFDFDGGDVLSFQWTQTAGTPVMLSDSTVAGPTFSAVAVGPGGEDLTFTLVVTDDDAANPFASLPDDVTIHVANINDPPSCNLAVANPGTLWPPTHKMESVNIDGVMDSDTEFNSVTLQITSVTQDEPVSGLGDGDSSPDAVIQAGEFTDSVLIRAERSGIENGRVYAIAFIASDGFEDCNGTVEVTVAHSRLSGAVDDGQIYDSTQP